MVRSARTFVVSMMVMSCASGEELGESDGDGDGGASPRGAECGGGLLYVADSFATIAAAPDWPGLQAVASTWPFAQEIDVADIDLQTALSPCGDALAPPAPVVVSAAAAIDLGCGHADAQTQAEAFPNLSADGELIAVALNMSPSNLAPYTKGSSASLSACADRCCDGSPACTNEYSASTDLLTNQEARIHGFKPSQDGWLRIDASVHYGGTTSSGEDTPGEHNYADAEWKLFTEDDPDDWSADLVASGFLHVDPLNPTLLDSDVVEVEAAQEYRLVITFSSRATSEAIASLCGDQDVAEGFDDGHSELYVTASFASCLEADPDLDGNGSVDGGDLGMLLAAWGTPTHDLNCDGVVDGGDLGILLAAWD